PSEEEIAAAKRRSDSIAAVEQEQQREEAARIDDAVEEQQEVENAIPTDSAGQESYKEQFGTFGAAAIGEDGIVTIENELLAINVDRKGGRPLSVELKEYHTYDSLPLLLFDGPENRFSLDFFAKNQRISTQDLYFEPSSTGFAVNADDSKSLTMRLSADADSYIEYVYTIHGNSYIVDFDINLSGMGDVVERNANSLDLNWKNDFPHQEKSLQTERENSTIYYRFSDDEVDYISERSDDKENITTDLQWVAFKQQFFSTVLIAKDGLEGPTEIETTHDEADTNVVKTCEAKMTIPYGHNEMEHVEFQFYFGPNNYSTLKEYDLGLEKLIPLGWGIFGWVNRFAVIPLFNLLKDTGLGYGIIILILTLVIKLVLLPLTYKAYMSTAKMRVL
ncbi:MAG: membrane protein insertase YidC, partial [Flavobacteriales bacterium]|nr:membrane protein insertase YidC [Flavobacteriales bacterium]